ncbi:unnamed protein product [Phytophthora fragariaefolia]|uniref:RxLR effector protein n=1 Tax=Phytophthora fragariaefolia TaxID=1490495 RepID=A0A9W6XIL8_9STRA|nr:unnamed protein product [Phytophthora fragariaefolia]
MRALRVILICAATVISSRANLAEAADVTSTHLSITMPTGVAKSSQPVSKRLLRSHKMQNVDTEERGFERLAAKLDDNEVLKHLKTVQDMTLTKAFQKLQTTGLPWEKRETIHTFVVLSADDRAAVLKLLTQRSAAKLK